MLDDAPSGIGDGCLVERAGVPKRFHIVDGRKQVRPAYARHVAEAQITAWMAVGLTPEDACVMMRFSSIGEPTWRSVRARIIHWYLRLNTISIATLEKFDADL